MKTRGGQASWKLGTPMTSTETQKYIKDLQRFTKELAKSAEACSKFLYNAGITTKKGNLRKPYRTPKSSK